MLSAATLLLATSCSEDKYFESAEGDGTVMFTVTLPDGGYVSRAFSNGLSADKLAYAVYDADTDALVSESTKDFGNSTQTTVSLTLANGKSYKVAFFAYNETDDVYTFNATEKTVSVKYENMKSYNSTDYDAFYNLTNTGTITGPLQKKVTLTRPLAQINWGTRDLTEGAVTATDMYGEDAANLVSKVIVKGVYTGFNLLDGTMVGNETDVTFPNLARPDAKEETFPVEPNTYKYLSMNYVLVPSTQSLVEAELVPSNGTTEFTSVKVTNLPVQANYRTNIYGALLTNPADFTVTKDNEYAESDYNKEVSPWDGETVTSPVIDEETKTGEISSASQLQGLADLTSTVSRAGVSDYEGYTFYLTSDIDFGGHSIKPIADGAGRSGSTATGAVFKGVIDGNGHTIKNLTLIDDRNDVYTGFIANLVGSTAALKNLTFENIKMEAPNCEALALVSLLSEGATIDNVKILSGSISGKQGVGGMAGRVLKDGHILNCSNSASVSGTTNNVGGIAGTAYYTKEGVAMTFENCYNNGNIHADNVSAGGIVGFSAADITNCKNEGKISAGNNSCGGIVGGQNARGIISNCINNGDIIAQATSAGFGGIIGWIRYETSTTNYPNQSIIELEGCENYGTVDITGSNCYGIAGIVGITYRNANISDCVNKSPKLSTSGMVAGITVYQNLGNSCPNEDPMLIVSGCTSTTNIETQMFGSNKAEIVYDNSAGQYVTLTNNTYSPAE